MPKYLLFFEKGEPVRWLGHLDILRTMERAVRRAELPVAFSEGFNPREKLGFVSALSVGITGSQEPVTLELTRMMTTAELIQKLNSVLPAGLQIQRGRIISEAAVKQIPHTLVRAEYNVVCSCSQSDCWEDVQAAVSALLAQATLPYTREREGRTRSVDIRPYLYALLPQEPGPREGRITLQMTTARTEQNTLRPAEVVSVLAAYLPGLALRRSHRIRLTDAEGRDALDNPIFAESGENEN